MDNGIAVIIASGVAGLVSLIIFVGSNIFSRMNADKPYKIKIHEKQLLEVFTPLEILLEKSDSNVTPELFKKLRKIIYSYLVLIPNSLLQEYKNIKSDKKRNVFVLRDIVSTYYNLRKKELGYPFKRESINIFCLDSDEALVTFIKSLKNPAWITLIIFAGLIALVVLMAIIDDKLLSLIKLLLLIFGAIAFWIWIMVSPSFKRKGLRYKKEYDVAAKKANNKKKQKNSSNQVVIEPAAKTENNSAN